MRWLAYENQSGYSVRGQIPGESDESMDALQAGASQSEKKPDAAKLKRKYWLTNCKVWAWGVRVLVIMVIIILWCLSMKKKPYLSWLVQLQDLTENLPASRLLTESLLYYQAYLRLLPNDCFGKFAYNSVCRKCAFIFMYTPDWMSGWLCSCFARCLHRFMDGLGGGFPVLQSTEI